MAVVVVVFDTIIIIVVAVVCVGTEAGSSSVDGDAVCSYGSVHINMFHLVDLTVVSSYEARRREVSEWVGGLLFAWLCECNCVLFFFWRFICGKAKSTVHKKVDALLLVLL